MKRPPSIRARVTLAATLAVALVLAIGGVLIVATFADRERSSFDRSLERRAQGPAGRVEVPPGDGPPPLSGRPTLERAPEPVRPGPPGLLAESGSFVRLIARNRVARQAGDVPENGFPLPEQLGFATVGADGRKWRTLTVEPPAPPEVEAAVRPWIQFAQDLGPVEDRISEMRTRVLLISALGVVAAALVAWLLGELALRPFSRLRGAVAGVSSTRDLSRRLPQAGAPEEVNELGRSVNSMLARLERSAAETDSALEATRRFAADVGHEIRTPVTSIRANLEALRRNPAMTEDSRQAILGDTLAAQDRLVRLLDALQALARGDAGAALPKETLDVAEIVDAAVEAAQQRRPEATITLEAPPEPQLVRGWPDGIRLLADNLIENAVRHGGANVRVTVAPDSARAVVVTVDDDGPGVPEDERTRVFGRFVRGEAAAPAGSGLGLALVAQQAALHGGQVSIADSPLGGARFEVLLRGS